LTKQNKSDRLLLSQGAVVRKQKGEKMAVLEKMNSLVITIDGTTYVFECHSYTKALEILAGQYEVHPKIDSFELV
jgi:hypothetical protein